MFNRCVFRSVLGLNSSIDTLKTSRGLHAERQVKRLRAIEHDQGKDLAHFGGGTKGLGEPTYAREGGSNCNARVDAAKWQTA